MMIPDQLDRWTIEHVRAIAALGVYESEQFDLKTALPHPHDSSGKHRLRKACAAFANSGGGFLVFGVSDDVGTSHANRIVGMNAAIDFPAAFGSFPGLCEPSVRWELKSPAIAVDANRVVHVVYVPPSWQGPHAVEDGDGWVFPKRTSKGTEPMSLSEVRQMFLGYYEKRLKLQLLRAELAQLVEASDRIALARQEHMLTFSVLPALELRVLETVLSDTYSILHSYPALLRRLAQLRPIVQMVNAYTETLRVSIVVHPEFGDQRIRTYGQAIESSKLQISNMAKEAITELSDIIQTP